MKNERHAWTSYDATSALVAAPLLIVAAMTIAAVVSWRSQSNQAERAWDVVTEEIGGDDVLALGKWYDEHKSKTQIVRFRRVLAASNAIMSQFDDCYPDYNPTEILRVRPLDQVQPFGQAIRELSEQARPILQLLASIDAVDANVWQPIILDGSDFQLPDAVTSRSLMRLLKIEFLEAFHQGERERAIEALTLLDRFYGPDYRSMCATEEMVCRDAEGIARDLVLQSLAYNFWTEADLDRIQQLVSHDVDWKRRWQDVTRGEILLDPPWQDKQNVTFGFPWLTMLAPRPRLAPSSKHDLAKRYTIIASTDSVASLQHYQTISANVYPSDNAVKAVWAPDQWLQLPRMNADWSAYLIFKSYAGTARQFALAASQQRFTRTAVAIKQFAVRNNRLPASLGELASVGLPPESIFNLNDQPFRYELGEDRNFATLWSNAIQLPATKEKTGPQRAFAGSALISK